MLNEVDVCVATWPGPIAEIRGPKLRDGSPRGTI